MHSAAEATTSRGPRADDSRRRIRQTASTSAVPIRTRRCSRVRPVPVPRRWPRCPAGPPLPRAPAGSRSWIREPTEPAWPTRPPPVSTRHRAGSSPRQFLGLSVRPVRDHRGLAAELDHDALTRIVQPFGLDVHTRLDQLLDEPAGRDHHLVELSHHGRVRLISASHDQHVLRHRLLLIRRGRLSALLPHVERASRGSTRPRRKLSPRRLRHHPDRDGGRHGRSRTGQGHRSRRADHDGRGPTDGRLRRSPRWCRVGQASPRPAPSLAADAGSKSCIRRATTTSQIIHARFRTQASTMAIIVRSRKAVGAGHPPLYQVGEAGEPHQVGDRPRDPSRPHDRGGEQEQCEAQREVLVAPRPPLEPADCLGGREARGLLGVRGARPRVHGLLEGNPVHRHDHAVQRQRHDRQNGAESTRPSRRARPNVQGEEQAKQPCEKDRRGTRTGRRARPSRSRCGHTRRTLAGWLFASPSAWNWVTTMYRSCPASSNMADMRTELRSNVVLLMTTLLV